MLQMERMGTTIMLLILFLNFRGRNIIHMIMCDALIDWLVWSTKVLICKFSSLMENILWTRLKEASLSRQFQRERPLLAHPTLDEQPQDKNSL